MTKETEMMMVLLLGAILSWLTPYPWWGDVLIVLGVIILSVQSLK